MMPPRMKEIFSHVPETNVIDVDSMNKTYAVDWDITGREASDFCQYSIASKTLADRMVKSGLKGLDGGSDVTDKLDENLAKHNLPGKGLGSNRLSEGMDDGKRSKKTRYGSDV